MTQGSPSWPAPGFDDTPGQTVLGRIGLATGDLDVNGGYGEARWGFATGAWLALRGETLRFSDVTTSLAVTRPWDDDADRREGIVGHRITRDVHVKLGMQRTIRHTFAAADVTNDLLAAGLSIRFQAERGTAAISTGQGRERGGRGRTRTAVACERSSPRLRSRHGSCPGAPRLPRQRAAGIPRAA